MNQKNKRIIAAAMSLTMLATATPLPPIYNAIQNAVSNTMMQANAADWQALGETDLVWVIEEGTLKIKVKEGGGTNTGMPDWPKADQEVWYGYKDTITSVEIEKGVTSIGNSAFRSFTKLENITIPDTVTSIGENVFSGDKVLASVTFADASQLETIGANAFFNCEKLNNVIIPDSVTTISDCAFQSCKSLTSITIPDSVTTISECAFQNCTSLTSITIPDKVTDIGQSAFSGCTSLTSITIPDKVTDIGQSVFQGCTSLENVKLPDSVTNIGQSAFQGCTSLENIKLPDSVTNIGQSAFQDCAGLTSITIPDKVTDIGRSAFQDCTGLTSLIFTGKKPTIVSAAFKNVAAKLLCPKGDTSWGTGSSLTLGSTKFAPVAYNIIKDKEDNDTNLMWYIDSDNKLTIGLVNSAETDTTKNVMPDWTDSGEVPWCDVRNSIKAADIADGVTNIGDYAFYECEMLEGAIIPASVTSIGQWTFAGSTSIESIIIPDSVTAIGNNAFDGCSALTDITAHCSLKDTDDSWKQGCDATVTYTHPIKEGETSCACGDIENGECGEEAYYSFNKSTGRLTISGTGEIEEGAFELNDEITSVEIGSGITGIGGMAFSECCCLENVIFAENSELTDICDCAFYFCESLENIKIPASVTSIGDEVFVGCITLEAIETDENNESYCSEEGVLYNKEKTELICYPAGKDESEYTIPASVTSIGWCAFDSCESLESVVFAEGSKLENIGGFAFDGCGFTEITLPKTVTNIGEAAFKSCEDLESIKFEGTLPIIIGANAFDSVGKADAPAILYYPMGDKDWELHLANNADKIENGILSYGGGKFKVVPYLNWNDMQEADLRWALSENGTLYIDKQENAESDGEFDIPAFSDDAPWKDSVNKINRVEISSSITGVNTTSFASFTNLEIKPVLVIDSESPISQTEKPSRILNSLYSLFGGGEFIYNTQITGASLSLDGKIGVNISFYVNEEEGSTVIINGETIDLSKCECKDKIYTYTVWAAPKDAYNDITFKTEKDGNSIVEQTYNVKEKYVDVVFKDEEHKQYREMVYNKVTALDTYINASRVYFGVETDETKKAEIASVIENIRVRGLGKLNTPEFNEAMYYGTSLVLESGVKLRHYFKIENKDDIENIKINVGRDSYGSDTLTKTKINGKEVYYFETEELNPAQFTQKVSIKCGDTNVIDNYCVLTFIKLVLEKNTEETKLGKICKAIYNYYDAVNVIN